MYWISKHILQITLSILHLQDFYEVAHKLLMSCNRVVTKLRLIWAKINLQTTGLIRGFHIKPPEYSSIINAKKDFNTVKDESQCLPIPTSSKAVWNHQISEFIRIYLRSITLETLTPYYLLKRAKYDHGYLPV